MMIPTVYGKKLLQRRPGYTIWRFSEVSVRKNLKTMKAFTDYIRWVIYGNKYRTKNCQIV